jgi:hypothetical protein
LTAAQLAHLAQLIAAISDQQPDELSRRLALAGLPVGDLSDPERLPLLRRQTEHFIEAYLSADQAALYQQPLQHLALALAEGLRLAGAAKPLVILIDSYERAATTDPTLREVIRTAGRRVFWVIAGRDNLASSRARDRFVGYRAEFARNLTVWEALELPIEYVHHLLQHRRPDQSVTQEEAAELHQATVGTPLSVVQAADLYVQGIPLKLIIAALPDDLPPDAFAETLGRQLLDRLDHEITLQADRRAFYLLALQPPPLFGRADGRRDPPP